MRATFIAVSLSALALGGCSYSTPKQNHLGLVAAPQGVVVDSKSASNPAPIASTTRQSWKRTGMQKQAELKSIERDAPYSSLK